MEQRHFNHEKSKMLKAEVLDWRNAMGNESRSLFFFLRICIYGYDTVAENFKRISGKIQTIVWSIGNVYSCCLGEIKGLSCFEKGLFICVEDSICSTQNEVLFENISLSFL